MKRSTQSVSPDQLLVGPESIDAKGAENHKHLLVGIFFHHRTITNTLSHKDGFAGGLQQVIRRNWPFR
jgi:hypothetical protein